MPDSLPLPEAAALCCSGTTALHAAAAAHVTGGTAVVYGVGGVGLALVQVLRRVGAHVIAVARSDERLTKARELGAEVTVNATSQDVAAAARDATDGAGADSVFELVGSAETGEVSRASLAKGGALVYVGYSFDEVAFSPLSMVVGSRTTHSDLRQ